MKTSKQGQTILIAAVTGILLLTPVGLIADDNSDNNYNHLIKTLSSTNNYWKVEAANHLGDEKNSEAVAPLIKMLEKENVYECKMAAIVALGKIGDSKALPILKKCAENESDKVLRYVANANYLELLKKTNIVIE